MNDTQLGWLAGIYEGEGSCGLYGPYGTGRNQHERIMLSIVSTDHDVLDAVLDLTGCGSIMLTRKATDSTKALWKWQISARKDVTRICTILYPLLHARRQSQMKPVIDWCTDRQANPIKPGPRSEEANRRILEKIETRETEACL